MDVSIFEVINTLTCFDSKVGRVYIALLRFEELKGEDYVSPNVRTIQKISGVGANHIARCLRFLTTFRLFEKHDKYNGFVLQFKDSLVAKAIVSYADMDKRIEALGAVIARNTPECLLADFATDNGVVATDNGVVATENTKSPPYVVVNKREREILVVNNISNTHIISSISSATDNASTATDETISNDAKEGQDMNMPKSLIKKATKVHNENLKHGLIVDSEKPLQERDWSGGEMTDYWLAVAFMWDWNKLCVKYPRLPKIQEAKSLYNGKGENNTHVKNIRAYIAECGDIGTAAEQLQSILDIMPKCPLLLGKVFGTFTCSMGWLFTDKPDKGKGVYKVLSGEYIKEESTIGDNKGHDMTAEEIERKKATSKSKYV
jgi:hypothetical protein